jgi:hypothetical protein
VEEFRGDFDEADGWEGEKGNGRKQRQSTDIVDE